MRESPEVEALKEIGKQLKRIADRLDSWTSETEFLGGDTFRSLRTVSGDA